MYSSFQKEGHGKADGKKKKKVKARRKENKYGKREFGKKVGEP
jgi:hypothetical protein